MTTHVKLPMDTVEEATAAAIFNPGAVLDELGTLKASIAILEAREKMLTEALKSTGSEKFSGTLFDATISRSERQSWDMRRLRADLGEEIMEVYAMPPMPVVTLKLTAKK